MVAGEIEDWLLHTDEGVPHELDCFFALATALPELPRTGRTAQLTAATSRQPSGLARTFSVTSFEQAMDVEVRQ